MGVRETEGGRLSIAALCLPRFLHAGAAVALASRNSRPGYYPQQTQRCEPRFYVLLHLDVSSQFEFCESIAPPAEPSARSHAQIAFELQ
jgi:hypothetical protein